MKNVSVWTDGSCLHNGKVGAISGIGIYYGDNDSRNYSSYLESDKQTNNRAELIAILYAIIMDFNSNNLFIHSDSKLSIDCITTYSAKWQTNGWMTSKGVPVESQEIIKCIIQSMKVRTEQGLTTKLEHVKAHSGNTNNDAADRIAKAAASTRKEGGRMSLIRLCGFPV